MLTETPPAPAGRTLAQTAAEALAEPTTPSMLGTWGADDLGDDFADLFVTD